MAEHEGSADIMQSWEVTLDLEGKWHCYQVFSVEESSRVMVLTNLKAIKRRGKWAIKAPTRSQALAIAKNDWKRRGNIKEEQVNINLALP